MMLRGVSSNCAAVSFSRSVGQSVGRSFWSIGRPVGQSVTQSVTQFSQSIYFKWSVHFALIIFYVVKAYLKSWPEGLQCIHVSMSRSVRLVHLNTQEQWALVYVLHY